MALHAAADPPSLLAAWQRALADDGFVMFSCFGPDTVRELRALYRRRGWGPPGADFVDMHDIGDMLVRAGFADPVMDQEVLTLTWATPEAALAELRSARRQCRARPRARPAHAALATSSCMTTCVRWRPRDGGRLSMTFEIVYGHAFKAAPRLPRPKRRPSRSTRCAPWLGRRAARPAAEQAAGVAAGGLPRRRGARRRVAGRCCAKLYRSHGRDNERLPAAGAAADRPCRSARFPAVDDGACATGRIEANVPESAGAMIMSATTLPSPFRVPSSPAGFRFGRESAPDWRRSDGSAVVGALAAQAQLLGHAAPAAAGSTCRCASSRSASRRCSGLRARGW